MIFKGANLRINSNAYVHCKNRTAFNFRKFDYISAPKDYYPIGICQEIVIDRYAYLIASPKKETCDMIMTTPGLRLQSVKAMKIYLEEDLRIDFSTVAAFDTKIIKL